MEQSFYSNGKLFIMGEYTVLDGAPAFALPTIFGQYLTVSNGTDNTIKWISKDADGSVWFEAAIPYSHIINKELKHVDSTYNTLIEILHEAHKANGELLNDKHGFRVTTQLTFPRQWGLGTSSTLINNVAQWFGIDAFELLNKSFGGSGYDIACAQNNMPIRYHLDNGKPVVEQVQFNPDFKDSLYFVYLNKKQNSRSAIATYREKRGDIAEVLTEVNNIIKELLAAKSLSIFCYALDRHEQLISQVLGMPTIKQSLFPDFTGSLKSLGAWGGDFILAATETDPTDYFKAKGYSTVIPYSQMILK